jgi:Rrf2 family protein
MRIPAATTYAVRALVELASAPEGALPLPAIAERQQISYRFLEHIFRDLRAAGLVASQRGGHGHGGYRLSVEPDRLTLADVVAATTGTRRRAQTGVGVATDEAQANAGSAELDVVWAALHTRVWDFLADVSIGDLVARRSAPPSG